MLVAGIITGAATADDPSDLISPFTEEAIARGLIYEIQPFQSPNGQFQGFGVAIADLNGNGHQDIILMGDGTGLVGFFENDGNGYFTDRSFTTDEDGNQVPKLVLPKPSGIATGDFTGNGLLDVYITQQHEKPNVLLRNDGDFNFTDVSTEAGVANAGWGEGAAWADLDNNGWLDLYVVNYTLPTVQDSPVHRNKVYRNLGDGTFEDISASSGLDDHGVGFTAVFSDINRNGWLDLFLVNDRGHLPPMFRTNQSWRNNGGTFRNNCDSSRLCLGLWSMGIGAGDITGNGFPDFYVTNLPNPGGYNGWNPLHINQGDWTFSESCQNAGVCQFILSWAAIFFDYDNNGWLDMYVCNQATDNRLYSNRGTFPLTNVTALTGIAGSPGNSFNAAVGDLTGNGALDMILNDNGSGDQTRNVQLFINHEGPKRNWVRFNVVGYAPNHHAIGSNVEITTAGRTQWRELYAGGNNFKAQNELVYHFGSDNADVIDEIVVNWPGGQTVRTLTSYPANHTWNIYPPEMLGDADGNGVIDVNDLFVLLSAWGPVQPGTEIMDLNGDGVIDIADLFELLAKWGPL